ncbi:agamous-like MADS-box protein AGL80 [Spinacia oleracea]|uniref:Agamous-like MADS-box protein AGL80 n=1 Tax=Spinacia oleracea TaxID=3562 RepID=A0ABM3RNR3_SPIOL|nr:agamous-like MADS-box protein AGL80 [Spinacia oleracea]
MTRKKVKLAYIENKSSRRATYKKRVKIVVKKTRELSVLCGIDTCTIVYGPDEQAPVVWPPCEVEAKRIISNFRIKSEVDMSERSLNQQTFLKESVNKAQEKLFKLQQRKREIQIENLATDIMSGRLTLEQSNPFDLRDLILVIENRMRAMQQRIRIIEDGYINNNQTILPNVTTNLHI